MIGVAVAAVLMNGARVMPTFETCRDGYVMWRGVQRARSDLALVGDTCSGSFRRALLNVFQSEQQLAWHWSEHAPDPIGGACLGALCVSVLTLTVGVPGGLLWSICRRFARGRASR